MELDEVAAILARVPFFEICDTEQQRLLAFASERRQYRAGEVIFDQGDAADGAYVLVRGSVAIAEGAEGQGKSYGVSGPNALVGEMALVLDRPRGRSATAVTNVDALFVPRSAFAKLMRQYPDMAARAAGRIEEELQGFLKALERFRNVPPEDDA